MSPSDANPRAIRRMNISPAKISTDHSQNVRLRRMLVLELRPLRTCRNRRIWSECCLNAANHRLPGARPCVVTRFSVVIGKNCRVPSLLGSV